MTKVEKVGKINTMKLVLIDESGNDRVQGGVFQIEEKYPEFRTNGFQQQALLEELISNLTDSKVIKDRIGLIIPKLSEEEHEALLNE